MTTWLIDVQERLGQVVLPTTNSPGALNHRFRKVEACTLSEAITRAQLESSSLKKLQAIHNGESAVMSDKELDWLIDQDVYPRYAVSIPNPERCGLLDVYLVACKDHPAMKAYGAKVTAEYESRPEIRHYRQQQGRGLT